MGICYLFKKLKPCSHQLNSKNNGLILSFTIIFRHWRWFLSSIATDGKDQGTWIKTWKSWANVFQVLMLRQQKSPNKLLWLVFLDKICSSKSCRTKSSTTWRERKEWRNEGVESRCQEETELTSKLTRLRLSLLSCVLLLVFLASFCPSLAVELTNRATLSTI